MSEKSTQTKWSRELELRAMKKPALQKLALEAGYGLMHRLELTKDELIENILKEEQRRGYVAP